MDEKISITIGDLILTNLRVLRDIVPADDVGAVERFASLLNEIAGKRGGSDNG